MDIMDVCMSQPCDWRPVQDVPLPLPSDSWDWLQHSHDPWGDKQLR